MPVGIQNLKSTKPRRPKHNNNKKTPAKSPRVKKMVVGNIVLPVDPVEVPKPYIPERQRGSLYPGAPIFKGNSGKRKRKKKVIKSKQLNRKPAMHPQSQSEPQSKPHSIPQSEAQSDVESEQQPSTQIVSPNKYSPSKQATSMTVVPSTPTVLFNLSSPPASYSPTSSSSDYPSTNNEKEKQQEQQEQEEEEEQEQEEEQIGIPFGSPRLFHDYRNKKKAREATLRMKYEMDAHINEASKLDSTIFFHSTGLQAKAMTNFSKEASLRSERRIHYLERLEERMIKAVEKDYSSMKRRVNILKDQRDVRRALAKAYEYEDQWISDLKLKRKHDRLMHKNAAQNVEETRRNKSHDEALKQKETNEYIKYIKFLELSKNRKCRNLVLKKRDEGTRRAIEYKRSKLDIIRNEKLKMAKRNRVKTVRRQRAIERNLETHGKMTERISRLLEYRNMYNSGKKSGKINIFFWGCFLFLDVILTHFSCTFN
jgi:hypothetical protein